MKYNVNINGKPCTIDYTVHQDGNSTLSLPDDLELSEEQMESLWGQLPMISLPAQDGESWTEEELNEYLDNWHTYLHIDDITL